MGLFYGLSTWMIGGAIGPDKVAGAAAKDPAGLLFNLAAASSGHAVNLAMQVLVVTSFIAMLLGLARHVLPLPIRSGPGGCDAEEVR